MGILVRALQLGYYGHKRRRAGDEFIMEDDAFQLQKDKDGNDTDEFVMDEETGAPKLPSWVELIDGDYQAPGEAKKASKKGKGKNPHADPAGRPLDSGKKNKYEHGGTSVADPVTPATERVPRTQDQEVI